ncbi:hypothetical protein Bca52824_055360 [Brassica carinata]|uniref:Neprosin PEP catalytic domain-containing protein n=1 Tax=Brassica carinata TaxID=52824 RepID=A0A8X7RBL6_BRACI|nr:hypothetical protein Bca52824_055360 [Brassica carinata]
MVGAGGVVQASRSGSSPEMGNGQFPNVNHPENSALLTNIEVLDSSYEQHKMNYVPTEVFLDSPKCYGLTIETLPMVGAANPQRTGHCDARFHFIKS